MKQFSETSLLALTKAELVDLAKKRKIAVSPRVLKARMAQIIHAALNKKGRTVRGPKGLEKADKKARVKRSPAKKGLTAKIRSKKKVSDSREPEKKRKGGVFAKKSAGVRERALSKKMVPLKPVPLTQLTPIKKPCIQAKKAPPRTPPLLRRGKQATSLRDATPSTGISRIHALLQDPQWAYCFWDLGADQKKEALQKMGCSEPETATILRVWDHTHPKEPTSFDITPDSGIDNYYIRLDEGKRYRLEIGLRSPGGKFHPVAKSNEIQTPIFFPPLRLETEALPQERAFTEEEFLKIYALAYGLDHDTLPDEILETVRGLPAATSRGNFLRGTSRN